MTNSFKNILILTLFFCVCGSFFARAWARTSSVNTADLWVASTYDAGDSVVWSAPNVTFKLHNNGTGGNIELYSDDHVLIQKAKTYRLEWRVANGYTINVTSVSVHVRSTLNDSYVTVGTNKSSNIGPSVGIGTYSTVNSQALTLGNTGYVTIYPESGYGDAIIHMDEITVTYTMDGVEKEVTFDGTDNWSTAEKYEPDTAFRVSATHVVFSLRKPMKQYNDYSWGKFKSHEYFFLDKDASSELRWWVDKGYSIEVSKIVLNASNGTSWGNRGKGYIHTSRMDFYDRLKVCESGTWAEVTFDKNGTNSNLYGAAPSVLGNGEYFILSATTAEFDIKTITLTYSITPKTYTITLDSEGGSDGSENVILTFDSNLHEAITNPTKEGCTFEGWYTGDNGTGTLVIDTDGELQANVTNYTGAGGIWKKDADDVTLYAKWSGVEYSVRFNANGGSGSMDNQAFTYGTAQNLTANTFTKTCTVTYDANGGDCGIASSSPEFEFLGWATSGSGDKEYDDEEEVGDLTTTADEVVDLYAKWETTAEAVELPTPTKADYVFVGWYNEDEELVGTAGDSYSPSSSETLKAHWKPGASSENNNDDVSDGKIVINGPHATFTIAGPTDIYYYTDGSCGDDGYFLASIDKEQSKTYTLSWSCDPSCTIEVTKISFWAKAYNWATGRASKAKVIFNEKTTSVGTAALTCSSADYAKLTESGSFSSPMTIECQNTFDVGGDVIPPYDFDFYLKNIVIEYTITPNAPTASETDLVATLNLEDKQTVDVSTLFSMTDPASDFTYSYRLKEAYTNAALEGNNFYATVGGDYEVQACVASAEDHEASAWSTATIHVTRVCVFNDSIGNKDWQTARNWLHHAIPSGEGTDSVRVMSNLTIDEQVQVRGLYIGDAAKVEIAPTGGLTVGAGGISGATSSNLILQAGTAGATKGQTGYLRISPDFDGDMPEAKVEMFTIAYHNKNAESGSKSFYQCMGAPISDAGVQAKTVFGAGSWLYTWNEDTEDWTNSRTSHTFVPFKGFEVTQKKNNTGLSYAYTGHVVSGSGVKTIDLDFTSAEKGYNLLANSWTASIDISQFESDDFVDVDKTIYILNAGTKNNSDSPGESVDAPGKWVGVPIKTAEELAADGLPRVIPSMQGFWVKAKSGIAQLKLDYSRLVWGVDYSGYTANKPLRAPKRNAENEDAPITGKLKVILSSESENDFFFMLESEQYDAAYEDGYDAMKIPSGSMDVFTVEGDDELGVDATNNIIGTRVGVRTGDETAYTLEFSHLSGENELALRDNETNEEIDINEGTQYTFFAEPNSVITERFTIVERQTPSITTGVDNADTNVKVHKFIKDNQVLILKNGILYNAMGAIVR